ncbi:MAG: PEP-CTERM sorting domain-containing protein [Sedimentisphaeraceae bacterium JB056]
MRIKFLILLSLVWISGAYALSGFLVSDQGELEGTGFWVDGTGINDWTPARIDWEVTDNGNSTWHYEYTLSVYGADVSHFILETSETFTESNIFNLSAPGTGVELGTFVPDSGNPSMPGSVYGIKFDSTSGTEVTISFDSDRDPVWGDFYAKCGNTGGTQNTVWNEGFLTTDPISAATDGTLSNHILVPDTVPEPATLALLGLGGMLIRRRRK